MAAYMELIGGFKYILIYRSTTFSLSVKSSDWTNGWMKGEPSWMGGLTQCERGKVCIFYYNMYINIWFLYDSENSEDKPNNNDHKTTSRTNLCMVWKWLVLIRIWFICFNQRPQPLSSSIGYKNWRKHFTQSTRKSHNYYWCR